MEQDNGGIAFYLLPGNRTQILGSESRSRNYNRKRQRSRKSRDCQVEEVYNFFFFLLKEEVYNLIEEEEEEPTDSRRSELGVCGLSEFVVEGRRQSSSALQNANIYRETEGERLVNLSRSMR